MSILVFASLISAAFAVPPVWYTGGQCGVSQYPDAGEMPLPPPPGTKIVGGQEARPYEFPWQVSVQNRAGGHFCGGSIINEYWVVCAAHCMVGETPNGIQLVVGEHDRSAASTIREIHDVSLIIVHEAYIPYTNDISLIKVTVPITFIPEIQPICAPDPVNLYEYYVCQCSGWGTVNSGGICCPNVLRYVTMNVTTNAYCDAIYTRDDITADMICATDNTGSTDRDSCQGDSGGPLSVKDSASGIFSLIGIVSWGIGCASGYPGVYTRVGYFADWVTFQISNN